MRLELDRLSVVFRSAGGDRIPALGPVSLTVTSGEFVALLGPSGCGKSTLIRVVAGLQSPTTGQALLDGDVITQPSERVGMMFQEPNLLPWRRVRDNMALPLELAGIQPAVRAKQAQQMLTRMGLNEFADAYPATLSGGMAQRVALGRVLMRQPRVLLLDEPFGALDALTRERISLDVREVWQQQQQTLLMVTHDINEAVMLAQRILVFSQRPGQIIGDIAVDLPPERTPELVYTPAFAAIAHRVRTMIEAA